MLRLVLNFNLLFLLHFYLFHLVLKFNLLFTKVNYRVRNDLILRFHSLNLGCKRCRHSESLESTSTINSYQLLIPIHTEVIVEQVSNWFIVPSEDALSVLRAIAGHSYRVDQVA